MRRWQRVLRLIVRRIWFRAALFSLLSVALALLAAWIAPIIPYDISAKIGAKAVDNILEILASSMLAVTTFSVTAMVSAITAATNNVTPRATKLLVEDSTAQNALSTFLGGFLFSVVGICALSTGLYGTTGRVILFAGTVLMILVIAVTLLRWIEHLSGFGRVSDAITRVEAAALRAASQSPQRVAARPAETPLPDSAWPAIADGVGYITQVDVQALGELAEKGPCVIHVCAPPGSFVSPHRPLARVEGKGDPQRIAAAFSIEPGRDFDHDPRFGLVVLSEIASRALSPGINDPGTAIGVLGAGLRVLSQLAGRTPDEAKHARVLLPPLALEDMLEDLFRPIARDGAGTIEVGLQLQEVLGTLAALIPDAHEGCRARAADALARAEQALGSEADRDAIRRAHRRIWFSG